MAKTARAPLSGGARLPPAETKLYAAPCRPRNKPGMSKTNTKAATPAPAVKPAASVTPGSAAPPAAEAVSASTASQGVKPLLNIGEIIARSIVDPNGPPAATPALEPSPAPEPSAVAAPEATDDPAAAEPVTPAEADAAPAVEAEDTDPTTEDPEPDPNADRPKRDGRQKRIDKLTARNAQLEAELESLRARLDQRPDEAQDTSPTAPAPQPQGRNPLSSVTNLSDLAARESEAHQVIDWADTQMIALRRNPEAVAKSLKALNLLTAEPEEATREDLEAALLSVRSNAERTVRVHIPQRREYIAASQHFEKVAVQEFPWWKDTKSQDYQLAQRVLSEWGDGVKQMPNWKMMVGVHVEGLKALEARRKSRSSAGTPSPAARPAAPRVPGLHSNPVAGRPVEDKAKNALQGVAKGKEGAVRDYFSAHLS